MPECHACEHNGKGRTVCLRCAGPAKTNNHGRSHVSMQAGADRQTSAEVDAVLRAAAAQPSPPRRSARMRDREAMVNVMRQVFEMDERSFAIVRHRFLHPYTPIRIIAKRYRVSTQAVHQRLKALDEAWPGIRELVGLRLKR